MKNGNDKWEFYKDAQDQWRWRRTAPNGNIVGAATEGYANIADCEGNARRNGWETDEMIEQDLANEEKKVNKKAKALYEDRDIKEGDQFAAVFIAERKKDNVWRKKYHSMQRNMLTLISILLVIIIVILLLTLFKTNPKMELSAKSLSDLKVMVLVLDPVENEKVVVFGDTYFDFGKFTLSEKAKKLLDKDVQVLIENPQVNVRMAGYTSAKGSEDYNQELSENRANSVRDYLIKKGIAPERITVIGYGRTKPALYEVTPGDIRSEEAKANMRVLFEVVVN
jgi:outer membrane protein OmpA-like peptidoglycan-associated protein